jgi:hypothetical protein
LLPEHLRLGTWDLVRSWANDAAEGALGARQALHLIHEAALCRPTLRADRSLRHRGFELANGLPWLPSDLAIHDLLEHHTIAQAQQLQIALGKLRQASGHFPGPVLALDPHRMLSYTQRDMVQRRAGDQERATKQAQSFFLLDVQSRQPVGVVNASNARLLGPATRELLGLAQQILPLGADAPRPLLVADTEHYMAELFDDMRRDTFFDLLAPMRNTAALQKHYRALPATAFLPHWPGFAIATEPFRFRRSVLKEPLHAFIQRTGERPEDYHYKGFVCTSPRAEVPVLTQDFPSRWRIEEFYRFDQDLGWKRAGTLNLHIRLGQMVMALVAQTVIHQLRQRLGEPFHQWDAAHFARDLFTGLEGDLRVQQDRLLVTYYNAPLAAQWKAHFENLPQRLEQEGVNPRIPWLYDFKLDFRFR